MNLRVKRRIQSMRFISNLKNVIYYHNVLIIPAALSCNYLSSNQLSQLGKRFKEKFYLFTSWTINYFNPQINFSKKLILKVRY
jgi:hypothetical protein